MNQVLYSSYGLYNIVNASFAGTAVNVTDQLTTMTRVKAVMDYWPLIAILGVLVWAFARSQKEEYERGYYG